MTTSLRKTTIPETEEEPMTLLKVGLPREATARFLRRGPSTSKGARMNSLGTQSWKASNKIKMRRSKSQARSLPS